jgi:hypothetical protein
MSGKSVRFATAPDEPIDAIAYRKEGESSAREGAGRRAHMVAAFRGGLAENGYVEGQNVTIEYRWALGQYDRLLAMAVELARRPVAVLAATGGQPAALAGQGRDGVDSNRRHVLRRSRCERPRRKPEPAGRKRHRDK